MRAGKSTTPGVVSADAVYTVTEFRARMRLGDFVWRRVRRHVRIIRVGRRAYVRGADWLDCLSRLADDAAPATRGPREEGVST